MIYVIASITFKQEKTDEILNVARKMIAESLQEKGCIAYDLHASVSRPGDYVFLERWEDRASLLAHMQSAHFQAWREASQASILSRKVEILTECKVESF